LNQIKTSRKFSEKIPSECGYFSRNNYKCARHGSNKKAKTSFIQPDAVNEIVKRATNVREVFFDFHWPQMQTIELLPEGLEHLPFLLVGAEDVPPYSGKFRRLKSLVIRLVRNDWFVDFCYFLHFKFVK